MQKNYNPPDNDKRTYIDGDWYAGGIPSNVVISSNACIDTSYGFAGFYNSGSNGMLLDEASGCYDRASFLISEKGFISVGKFSILNGCTIICNSNISIGNHCMLAWGSVITDSWPGSDMPDLKSRQSLLLNAAQSPLRHYPFPTKSAPVFIDDNAWVGFDSVIMPGVRLGRGCIIGCKTIIEEEVPPYAVVAGSPARIIKFLDPDDTNEARENALKQYIIS